jgi:hypothetical protein
MPQHSFLFIPGKVQVDFENTPKRAVMNSNNEIPEYIETREQEARSLSLDDTRGYYARCARSHMAMTGAYFNFLSVVIP